MNNKYKKIKDLLITPEGYLNKKYKTLLKENKEINNFILEETFYLPSDRKIQERIYIIYKKKEKKDIKCPICNKYKIFNDKFYKGYKNTCGEKKCIYDYRKISNIQKYGVSNPIKLEETKEKIKKTNIDKYGEDNLFKTKIFKEQQKEKIKKNQLNKKIHFNRLKLIKKYKKIKIKINKRKEYINNIYDKTSFFDESVNLKEREYCLKHKIKEISICIELECNNKVFFKSSKKGYEDRCEVCYKKYNNMTKEEKTKQTNIIKYGSEYTFKSEDVKKKIKETHQKKYGVSNPSKSLVIRNKVKNTFLKKYGNKEYLLTEDYKKKSLKTNKKKYGVNSYTQKDITNYQDYNEKRIMELFINNHGEFNYDNFVNYFNISYYHGYKKLKEFKNLKYKIIKTKAKEEKKIISSIRGNYKLLTNNQDIIEPYEIDLYLELIKNNKKIGIEYNGLMFHSFGKSKYSMFNNYEDEKTRIPEEKYKNLYQINQKTYKNNEKHLLKTELCENKNIKLFHINENEWLDAQKQLIWKSIINNELGNNIIKIGARNTYIKELNSKKKEEKKLKDDFLWNNHIQGGIASNNNIGLFTKRIEHNFNKFKWYPSSNHIVNKNYPNMPTNKILYLSNLDNKELYIIPKDTLVSLMTFGKPRFNKEYNWELLRFCNKINSSIVGAGTKLLKYFKNNYMKEDDKLISYGNRRWTNSHNNFYINNGFTFLRKSEPSFYYFHESNINKLYHRTHFQKYKLENYFHEGKYNIKNYDKTLPAQIIMYNNDYRKIWDSGNLVFELNKQ